MNKLRKGKTKSILESSMDSALSAVEIYNKPRTTFRVETYITLMVIAWTKLFHAYFHKTIGDTYYHKGKNNRYILIDGEKKAWELSDCIKEFQKIAPADKRLSEAVKNNLLFIVKLRNKIEHRYVEKIEIEKLVFGECQALLYNYESMIQSLFNSTYSINESLVFALQFSSMRFPEQQMAQKRLLSREYKDIRNFIEKYRSSLPNDIVNAQEFSIKFLMIPCVANSSHNDLAMHFVDWNTLTEDEKAKVNEMIGIIKNRNIPVANQGRMKPTDIVEAGKKINSHFNHTVHMYLYYVFSIRPKKEENKDPSATNSVYCVYDAVHRDYSYTTKWKDFVINFLREQRMTLAELKDHFDKREKKDLKNFI